MRIQRIRDFTNRTALEIWQAYEDQLKNAGYKNQAQIYSTIENLVMDARKQGFCTESQMRLYVDACIILGAKELESPTDPTLAAVLGDEMLHITGKCEFLEKYLVFVSR